MPVTHAGALASTFLFIRGSSKFCETAFKTHRLSRTRLPSSEVIGTASAFHAPSRPNAPSPQQFRLTLMTYRAQRQNRKHIAVTRVILAKFAHLRNARYTAKCRRHDVPDKFPECDRESSELGDDFRPLRAPFRTA